MQSSSLPQDFVYLEDIDSTIVQSVRYAGDYNFLGRPVDGYNASRIILTNKAALALREVQNSLKQHGYGLVVYDGYRPQRAVENFIAWSQNSTDQVAKDLYYPTIDKRDSFKLGYIASKSGHTRGGTVDLTIIASGKTVRHPIIVSQRTLTNGTKIPFLDDNTEDMGSSFDLFHEASSHDTSLIENDKLIKRRLLKDHMEEHGFFGYSKEWWHYRLINESFPDKYFDFVVE